MSKNVKRILAVRVKNIRGIQDKTFRFNNLTKHIPNLIVAPNGYGKSSITEAFSNVRSRGVFNFEEKEKFYNHDTSLDVLLEVEVQYDDLSKDTLVCSNQSNDLGKVFDTLVINSVVKPNAKLQHTAYRPIARPFLDTEEIVLLSKIPKAVKLTYSFSRRRSFFKGASSLLKNITPMLNNPEFIVELYQALTEHNIQTIGLKNEIQQFINDNASLTGNVKSKESSFNHTAISSSRNKSVDLVKKCICKYFECLDDVMWINVVDIVEFYRGNASHFKEYYEYCLYLYRKKSSEDLLLSFSPAWKQIKPSVSKDRLILKLPRANYMSKGEGDLLAFLGQLAKFRFNGYKKNTILILDEILDYLDDSNLLAIQFYLTEIINEWKVDNKNLFLLIFTHLDPLYFKQFSFKKQHVHFIKDISAKPSKSVEEIIISRKEEEVEKKLGKYFFHFNPIASDSSDLFEKYKLDKSFADSNKFYEICHIEVKNYITNASYDPMLLCCGIRHIIEKYLFSKLETEQRTQFIDEIHGTEKKLRFCEDYISDIPDAFYLLKPIYNNPLHLSTKYDRLTPIVLKLENLIIKGLVKKVYDYRLPA